MSIMSMPELAQAFRRNLRAGTMNIDLLNSHLHPIAHVTLHVLSKHESRVISAVTLPGSSHAIAQIGTSYSSSSDSTSAFTARMAAVIGWPAWSARSPISTAGTIENAVSESELSGACQNRSATEIGNQRVETSQETGMLGTNVEQEKSNEPNRRGDVGDGEDANGDEEGGLESENQSHYSRVARTIVSRRASAPIHPTSLATPVSRKRKLDSTSLSQIPQNEQKRTDKATTRMQKTSLTRHEAIAKSAEAALICKWKNRIGGLSH